MIIDPIGSAVSDYDKSKEFFCRALAPLGIELVREVQGWTGPSPPAVPTTARREFKRYHPNYFGAFVLGPTATMWKPSVTGPNLKIEAISWPSA